MVHPTMRVILRRLVWNYHSNLELQVNAEPTNVSCRTVDRLEAMTHSRGEVEFVAGDMLKKSVNFVSKMFIWMTGTVYSQEQQQPDVPQSEHWRFVSQVVCSIF